MSQPHLDLRRYTGTLIPGGFRHELPYPMPPGLRSALEEHEYRDDFDRVMQGKRVLQRLNQQDLPTWQRTRRESLNNLLQLQQGTQGNQIRRLKQQWRTQGGGPAGSGSSTPKPFSSELEPLKPHTPHGPPEPLGSKLFDRTWIVPTNRRDPYPREVVKYPLADRQSWLRSYYRANPLAAEKARADARIIIDFAHRTLR